MNGHLLSIHDVSAEEIVRILDTAESFREVGTRVIKKVPALRGRTVVNLFYENSTRTRISFELAAKRLSADVINFSTSGSSVSKGESLKDTALTLQAMGADAIVIRHSSSGAPLTLTRWVKGSVLNAGDGTHEHPTQALLDLYTMRDRLGRLEGLRVAIVGDVLHSRVARSLSFALVKMGAEVTLVGPADADPAGRPGVGRAGEPRHRGGAAQARCLLHAPRPAGAAAAAVLPERPRVRAPVRPVARAGRDAARRRARDAPGPDEPWRRDRLGRRRSASGGDRGAGDERDRRADVAPVPPPRRVGLPAAGGRPTRPAPSGCQRRWPRVSEPVLFRGARVVDPASGQGRGRRRARRRGRRSRRRRPCGRDRPRLRRPGAGTRPRRPPHPPAPARPRGQGDGRVGLPRGRARRLHRGLPDGEHRSGGRQRGRDPRGPRAGPRRRNLRRLPRRRDHARPRGRGDGRARRDGRRGRPPVQRRRALRAERARAPQRAHVRPRVRGCGDRGALRGRLAGRGRTDARGAHLVVARARGPATGGGGGRGRPRSGGRATDGRPAAPVPPLVGRLGRDGAPSQGRGSARHARRSRRTTSCSARRISSPTTRT